MRKKRILTITIALALVAAIVGPTKLFATVPGTNTGINLSVSGGNPNTGSAGDESTSQDGRYVTFVSNSTNLVSPSTNGQSQIFVRDRLNDTTILVSESSSGTQGNSYSEAPKISADGRYVVFESHASNLVSGDTNSSLDVFMRDLDTSTTTLISKNVSGTQGNNGSQSADVSADGQYVVFQSYATNLVSTPSVSSGGHVYLKNTATGSVQLLSQSSTGSVGNGDSFYPSISCEGRIIAFQSYSNNLVSDDTNNSDKSKSRVYYIDMLNGIAPISITGSGDDSSAYPKVSCNGSYISFVSSASNLVSGDTNGKQDIFVFDRLHSTIDRDSVSSSSAEANSGSYDPSKVSNDGKYILFSSDATDLVSGDTNAENDIFIHNRQTGVTEIVSKNSSGTLSNGSSVGPDLSQDGKYAIYYSNATNLVSGYTGQLYGSQTGSGYDY